MSDWLTNLLPWSSLIGSFTCSSIKLSVTLVNSKLLTLMFFAKARFLAFCSSVVGLVDCDSVVLYYCFHAVLLANSSLVKLVSPI